MAFLCWHCNNMSNLTDDGACEGCGHVPDIMLAAAKPIDPWVVVGRTTIDGVAEDIADALGMATASHLAENVDAMIRDGATVKVGGRTVRPREWKRINADFCLLACDIVRRKSEIDIEEAAASFARMGEAIAEVEAEQCPECGPHGNRGRVVLAFSEVACTVCAGGKPGDAFGVVDTSRGEPDALMWSGVVECRKALEKTDAIVLSRDEHFRNMAKDAMHGATVFSISGPHGPGLFECGNPYCCGCDTRYPTVR